MASSYNELFGLGSHSVDSSLRAWWKLQETTGTTAADSSGDGNDLAISGMGSNPTTVTGPTDWLPSAFHFDGNDDQLEVAGPVTSGDNQTILMWMLQDDDPPVSGGTAGWARFGEGINGSASSSFPYSDGTFYVSALRGTGAFDNSRIVFGPLSVDLSTAWRKVSFRTTPGAGGWECFVDGTQEETATGITGLYIASNVRIGRSDFTNGFYKGAFAGIAMFDRKITDAEEVQAFAGPEPLYTSGKALSLTGTTFTGNVGTWDSQDNGTVSVAWELRDSDDDSVEDSGTAASGGSIGGSGTFSGNYYLFLRASNDGGYDSAEDQTQSATAIPDDSEETSDTITFAQEVLNSVEWAGVASDTLALTDDASGYVGLAETVLDTLAFVSVAEGSVGILASASDSIAFLSEVLGIAVPGDREVPRSDIEFVQTLFSPTHPDPINTLELIDEATYEIFPEPKYTQFMSLTQEVEAYLGIPWLPVEINHDLGLTDELGIVTSMDLNTTFAVVDVAIGSLGLSSSLGLSQSVSGGRGKDGEDFVSFVDVASTGGSEWLRSASHTIPFESNSAVYNPNNKCDRRMGAVPTSTYTLTLTSSDGAHQVTLRNPERDNVRRVAFNRVLRETRGGDLTVYRDPNWVSIHTLLFTVVAMKAAMFDQLQQFFLDTLGQEVFVTDWLGEEWVGIVTHPDEVFTEDRDGFWTFAFEFEGFRRDGKGTRQSLALTQVVTVELI